MNGLRKLLLLVAISLLPVVFGGCGSHGSAAVNGQPVVESPAAPVKVAATKPGTANPEAVKIETAPVEAATATGATASTDAAPTAAVETPAPVEPAEKAAPTASATSVKTVTARIVDKTFDDVKFEMDLDEPFRRELVGDKVEGLVGQRIRIRGYILPTAQKRGLKQFVLVRDNQQCCFGPGAALYDCILIEMQAGRTAEFTTRPVAIEGTFNIDVLPGLEPGDKPLAIYRLDGEAVK